MADADPDRILSIQSHVVSGYVGNRAATFPLQLLGFDVDVVNTVQFSNHTGYGHTNGHKTTPEQLEAVFSGLEKNGLEGWGRMLTGYIPGAAALKVVDDQVRKVKKRRLEAAAAPKGSVTPLVYLLDPVMGDIGKGLYVAEDVVPIYRRMLGSADIISPNAFELEILAQSPTKTLSDIQTALRALHTGPDGVQHIAISSAILQAKAVRQLDLPSAPELYRTRIEAKSGVILPDEADVLEDDEVLVCFASQREGDGMQTWAFGLPTVQGYYSGVGDLFSAMVLGFYRPTSSAQPFYTAVSAALLTVQLILLKTHLHTMASLRRATPADRHAHAPQSPEEDCLPSDPELDGVDVEGQPTRLARRSRKRELRIVQERLDIEEVKRRVDAGEECWPGAEVNWSAMQNAAGQRQQVGSS